MPIYIGETSEHLVNGRYYTTMQVPMMGRIYKPGKDIHGKWIDTVGEKDNRIMVWKHLTTKDECPAMKVYESVEAIAKDWDNAALV